MPHTPLEIKPFSSDTENDFVSSVNRYLSSWPYTRQIDDQLVAYWKSREDFEPAHMLIGYENGCPATTLHGQMVPDRAAVVHLLAVLSGKAAHGAELLTTFESLARKSGYNQLIGPHWAAQTFYGGYVLGNEPYHPHWATDATNAYVQAGMRISHPAVILVHDLSHPIEQEQSSKGYEIVEVETPKEFTAQTFGYHAMKDGQKAAHCYARWYPQLLSPSGKTVGQIGNVTTEEQHRSKGLARHMVKLCLDRLWKMGVGEVLIATGMDNHPALKTYENAGFNRRFNINEWSKKLRVNR